MTTPNPSTAAGISTPQPSEALSTAAGISTKRSAFNPSTAFSVPPLGMTPEIYQQAILREEACKTVCGGLLGDCYVLQEIIDGLMSEAILLFRDYKWYRHQLKQSFRRAHAILRDNITRSCLNSKSNTDYMHEVADLTLEAIRSDLYLMENGISLDMGKAGVKDQKPLAKMVTVEVLMQYCSSYYDSVIEHMCTIYGDRSFYDSWYSLASCDAPLKQWKAAMDMYIGTHLHVKIDLNKFTYLTTSLLSIQNKLRDLRLSQSITNKAAETCDPGSGVNEYTSALHTLGVTL